jgi:hypothetical protein
LNEQNIDAIKREIHNDASTTLGAMQQTLRNQNVNVSKATIHRSIKSFGYSFKRMQYVPERRNVESNIICRFNYARSIFELNMNKLVFIVENDVNCPMRKRYGHAPLGTSPRKTIRTLRSKKFSICAAMSIYGILNLKLVHIIVLLTIILLLIY